MRSSCWLVGVLAVGIAGNRAAAQAPPSEPPAEREGPADYLLTPCPPTNVPNYTVDFIFGLPTGFRIQRPFDAERVWHLEGFVGFELIFPTVGGGFRRRYEPLCGKHDALIVAPGIDAYAMYNPFWDSGFFFSGGPPVVGALVADVDVLWRHSFGERCQSQLGFKIGGGVGKGANWGPVPVLGVFSGIRW